MLVRDKESGKEVEFDIFVRRSPIRVPIEAYYGEKMTIELLQAKFEDVHEPLINDGDVRQLLRCWAKADGVNLRSKVEITFSEPDFYTTFHNLDSGSDLEVSGHSDLGVERGRVYTIEELCGVE